MTLHEAVAPVLRDLGASRPSVGTAPLLTWRDLDDGTGLLRDARGRSRQVFLPAGSTPSAVAVEMAALVQRTVNEDRVDPWPTCEDGHVLVPVDQDGTAVWTCPADGSVVAELGRLVSPEEAERLFRLTQEQSVTWFARYDGMTMAAARDLARQEGRRVRVVGPTGARRTDFMPSRLNLLIGPDGELLGMDAG